MKPSKHICLGLGIKSMTGSRKVVEMLNHFGHCINYHKVEEIETNLATNIQLSDFATPDGIIPAPGSWRQYWFSLG